MRRAALILAVLGLVASMATGVATAAPQRLGLSPAGTPKFPERAYRLSLPTRRGLLPQDLRVTENGDPVSKLKLTSADAARGGDFGAILVIDASASMHGGAIAGAMGAARELATQRTSGQQLGVVVFNRTAKVLLAPSADQQEIDAVLARTPTLAPQTHIFDAVAVAEGLLERAHITAGSIVLLSDGSDTGSRASAQAVAARALRSNFRIYTVGLRSRAFNSGELKDLAAAGGGAYSAAASISDLRRIYREIGAQLASEYLVEYRSFARPGRDVTVAAHIVGTDSVGSGAYRVPGGATFVQIEDSFWTSTLGVIVTGLLSASLLALGLGILLARSRRAPTVRERIRGFVSTPAELALDEDTVITGRAASGAERSLEKTQWWQRFKLDVEVARIMIEPIKIVAGTLLATLVMFYVLAAVTGLPLVGVFALAIPWGVRTWVRIASDRQRALFVEQLPETLQGASSAIRAGHGLVAALSMVAQDAPEPSRAEFLRVVADEALGVPLDDALRVVQDRMDSREVMQIALIAQIQREAGGNMAEVLDRITEALRGRAELRRMVKALTAQGRLSRWVVTALPVGLLLVISVANPAYVHPLYTTPFGVFMLVAAGVLMLVGSVVIGKIVDFKV
jgi:tight adherence protein B